MRRPAARRGASRYLMMGLLALAACGRGEAPSDAAPLKGRSAALESGADLVVTELRGPANVRQWQGFTATVKVCNQGTAPSYNGSFVELLLSTDDELTMPGPNTPPGSSQDQVVIGSVAPSQALYPGQCETRSVYASATLPPAAQGSGAYYLAAAVDTQHAETELREDNNLLVSGLMGVGYGADLVVRGVKAPVSIRGGYGFTATVEVCNQGTTPTQGGSSYPYYDRPRVELFLSMDAELTLPDPNSPSPSIPMDQMSIGVVELDTLDAGQCVKKDVQASSALPPAAQGDGAYYLVAAVDTKRLEQELREDNNVRVGGLLGLGSRPDLVVTEVKGPASVRSGDHFMATVKVCNQGTTSSSGYYPGSRLELFLSRDTELTLPDPYNPSPVPQDQMSLGYVALYESLSPAQCVTKSVPVSAWPPPGTPSSGAYYLAAAIDTTQAEQELREDNNVHVGGLMGVGYGSDLVVTEVGAPASVMDGSSFTASVKVCNQGTTSRSSYGPRVELFLSRDEVLTLPTPGQPSPPPGMPEEQRSIGSVELTASLQPGQCVTRSMSAYASSPAPSLGEGPHYLVAAADTTHSELELREDNNVRVHGLLGVGYGADLVVSAVSAPANVQSGQGFTASVKVCNQGTKATDNYYSKPRVELLLSVDDELTLYTPGAPPSPPSAYQEQVTLGSVQLDQHLQPGQCVTKELPAYASLPPAAQGQGTYHLAAVVDPSHEEYELREDNNVLVSGLLGVGSGADLVVSEVNAPANVQPGQGFTASVKVCNQGTIPTSVAYPAPRVELLLSMDATVSMPSMPPAQPGSQLEQVSIGSVELDGPLYPAQCVTKDVSASAWPPPAAQGDGTYYLAAAVDVLHAEQELREDNNVHVKGLLGVGYAPDLVVTEVSAPATLRGWQDAPATVKVCNQGTITSSGAAWLQVLLSMEAQLTPPMPGTPLPGHQVRIGSIEVAPLTAGQCVTMALSIYPFPPPESQGYGVYHLGASIDTELWVQELREDNNTRTVGTVELTP